MNSHQRRKARRKEERMLSIYANVHDRVVAKLMHRIFGEYPDPDYFDQKRAQTPRPPTEADILRQDLKRIAIESFNSFPRRANP